MDGVATATLWMTIQSTTFTVKIYDTILFIWSTCVCRNFLGYMIKCTGRVGRRIKPTNMLTQDYGACNLNFNLLDNAFKLQPIDLCCQ